MNANQIIRRPLVTEKSTLLREGANVVAFEVDPKANSIQVKSAVEELFKVRVLDVRLFNVRGKIKHEGPGNDYTFDFDDPEGNRLQFFCDMDRIGWDGKSRPKEQWKRFEVDD